MPLSENGRAISPEGWFAGSDNERKTIMRSYVAAAPYLLPLFSFLLKKIGSQGIKPVFIKPVRESSGILLIKRYSGLPARTAKTENIKKQNQPLRRLNQSFTALLRRLILLFTAKHHNHVYTPIKKLAIIYLGYR